MLYNSERVICFTISQTLKISENIFDISKYWHPRSDACYNWFDISTTVQAFAGLHTNRKRDSPSYTCKKFYSRWPHEVNAFLSNDTETLKSGEFLFSSLLVLVVPRACLRGLSMEKEAVGRIKCCRFSQNDEDGKTSFMQLFLHEIRRAFRRRICQKYNNFMRFIVYNIKYNNSNFYKWKTGVTCITFYHKENKFYKTGCSMPSSFIFFVYSLIDQQNSTLYVTENCPV